MYSRDNFHYFSSEHDNSWLFKYNYRKFFAKFSIIFWSVSRKSHRVPSAVIFKCKSGILFSLFPNKYLFSVKRTHKPWRTMILRPIMRIKSIILFQIFSISASNWYLQPTMNIELNGTDQTKIHCQTKTKASQVCPSFQYI